MYLIEDRSKFISIFKCSKRPGVAMMISGLEAMDENCSSRLSPPTSKIVLRSVPLPISFTTLSVCRANSREGDKITALAPTFALCDFNFSIMGITKAAVFPEPVLAIPTTSWPSRMTGMVLRWIGVGTEKPLRVIALSRCPFRPMDWKPPPFLIVFPVRSFVFLLLAAC